MDSCDGIEDFGPALSSNGNAVLEEIIFRENRITKGFAGFCKGIQSLSSNLRIIDFTNCNLSPKVLLSPFPLHLLHPLAFLFPSFTTNLFYEFPFHRPSLFLLPGIPHRILPPFHPFFHFHTSITVFQSVVTEPLSNYFPNTSFRVIWCKVSAKINPYVYQYKNYTLEEIHLMGKHRNLWANSSIILARLDYYQKSIYHQPRVFYQISPTPSPIYRTP